MPGEDTAGIFLNVSAEACGARCLANIGCRSFDYGMETCLDTSDTGYVNVSAITLALALALSLAAHPHPTLIPFTHPVVSRGLSKRPPQPFCVFRTAPFNYVFELEH